MAADFNLPALLHVRRSHADTIAALKRFRLKRCGIVHAFAGSREEAREYIKLGYKLGLGGAATWPQALRMHRVIADLPLESVVLETDHRTWRQRCFQACATAQSIFPISARPSPNS